MEPEQVKEILKDEMERRGISYGKFAKILEVSKGALHRFITDPDYIPTNEDLRAKLGLDPGAEIIVQIVTRDPKGRWAK